MPAQALHLVICQAPLRDRLMPPVREIGSAAGHDPQCIRAAAGGAQAPKRAESGGRRAFGWHHDQWPCPCRPASIYYRSASPPASPPGTARHYQFRPRPPPPSPHPPPPPTSPPHHHPPPAPLPSPYQERNVPRALIPHHPSATRLPQSASPGRTSLATSRLPLQPKAPTILRRRVHIPAHQAAVPLARPSARTLHPPFRPVCPAVQWETTPSPAS